MEESHDKYTGPSKYRVLYSDHRGWLTEARSALEAKKLAIEAFPEEVPIGVVRITGVHKIKMTLEELESGVEPPDPADDWKCA